MTKTSLLVRSAGILLMSILLLAFVLREINSVDAHPSVLETKLTIEPDRRLLHFPPDAPQLAYLRIAPIEEIPEPAADALPARITYDEDVTARVSTPIAGRVLRLLARPGDRIQAGQALLWLDAPEYGTAVSDAIKAKAARQRDEQAYKRAQLLFDGGVLARRELESSEADLAQSRAEERRASARLRNLAPGEQDNEAGERYVLRAPISGLLVDRQVNPGSEVRPDAPNPLFVITKPERLWVQVDLPESELNLAHAGQPAMIEVDAWPGAPLRGRVAYVGTVLDATTRRIPVRVTVENKDGQLRPEMFARVTLLTDTQKKVIRVPNTAVNTEGVNSYVFVEKEPGTLEKRAVTLARQSQEYGIVTEGLTVGERIVTKGAILLNAEFATGNQ